MGKRQYRWSVRIAACIGLFLLSTTTVRAAGEWEWTKDQGWVQGAGAARPTPKEQLQYAYDLEQRGDYMDSARQYFLLIQTFPSTQEAGVGLQRLARCLFEMENYYNSYKAIEQVIKDYPGTGAMSDLVEIELRIAKKMMVTQTPDLFGGNTGRDHNIRQALEIVDAVLEHDPYGPVAAEAYLVKGEGHLFINEVQAARKSFETLRDEFPKSDYIERARLGILTCDSLMGQANPREVEEQAQIVRETEREQRAQRRGGSGFDDEDEDVESFIRKQNEVEAAKMLDQAEQYNRMGTKKHVESAKFMYNEVVRRYPDTAQADTARERLGQTKTPKEAGFLTRAIKGVNLNPFTMTKDPEPPWIVPQLNPDDMVMVDQGLNIAGVPEMGTAAPPTSAAAPVRPASLSDSGNYSPIPEDNLSSAPDFVDGMASAAPRGGYSPVPSSPMGGQGGFGPGQAPQPPQQRISTNPIPGSEGDLVGVPAERLRSLDYTNPAPIPELSPTYSHQPNLGNPMWNTSDSDLVGPTSRNTYMNPPIPEYGMSDLITTDPQPGSYYASPTPTQSYPDPYYQQPDPNYAVPSSLGSGRSNNSSNGGWTFGEEFR